MIKVTVVIVQGMPLKKTLTVERLYTVTTSSISFMKILLAAFGNIHNKSYVRCDYQANGSNAQSMNNNNGKKSNKDDGEGDSSGDEDDDGGDDNNNNHLHNNNKKIYNQQSSTLHKVTALN